MDPRLVSIIGAAIAAAVAAIGAFFVARRQARSTDLVTILTESRDMREELRGEVARLQTELTKANREVTRLTQEVDRLHAEIGKLHLEITRLQRDRNES